jgi:hypothetical protein
MIFDRCSAIRLFESVNYQMLAQGLIKPSNASCRRLAERCILSRSKEILILLLASFLAIPFRSR